MPFKISAELVIKIILWVIFWGLLASLSAPLMAAANDVANQDSRTSKSISFTKSAELDEAAKDVQLKQADADIMESLDKEGFRVESALRAASTINSEYGSNGDIIIYDASTELISDFNNDGFYHRFSVTIDADTVYETAYIYARLYLSFEGGPWNHYATSDNYHIYGDSELDTFVIETELADGFPPGYYDVRIELYDADIDDWLLSYGPYDDASLSALPLEDSYFDDQYPVAKYPVETQVVVAGHGGSASWWLLLLPVVISAARRRGFSYEKQNNWPRGKNLSKRPTPGCLAATQNN